VTLSARLAAVAAAAPAAAAPQRSLFERWLDRLRHAHSSPATIIGWYRHLPQAEAEHIAHMALEQGRVFATAYYELGPEAAQAVAEGTGFPPNQAEQIVKWLGMVWVKGSVHPLARWHTHNWFHWYTEYQTNEHAAACEPCGTVARTWEALRQPDWFGPEFGDPKRERFHVIQGPP
jgi:hypothetical protein